MDIGEVRTMKVASRRRWNRTGVRVRRGQRYGLTGSGRWNDLFYSSDPGGHDGDKWVYRMADSWRWASRLPWFCLVGALDHDRNSFFLIGLESTWSVLGTRVVRLVEQGDSPRVRVRPLHAILDWRVHWSNCETRSCLLSLGKPTQIGHHTSTLAPTAP